MLILGLNAFHADSSAALIRDGVLVAAAEEERFRRVKHWAGFPTLSIAFCLRQAGVSLTDVNHIAINQNSRSNIVGKLRYLLWQRPNIGLILNRLRTRRARQALPDLLAQAFPDARFTGGVHSIEHHVAHLSSAFHVSPFEEAAIVSVDGFGDFSSAAWGAGHGTSLSVDGRVHFPHSLGILYQAMTQYLGFPHYGDEYKVMGLAPYGEPSRLATMRKLLDLNDDGSFELNLDYFRHHRERISYQWEDGVPAFADLFTPVLEDLLGPRRKPDEPIEEKHRDIARSTQALYEEAFFNLLHALECRHGLANIALAGGCAMNSVANGKIRRSTKFKKVYVQSAAGDAGGAIGAAFATWHQLGGARSFVMDHAHWGPEFSREDIEALLAARAGDISGAGCVVTRPTTETECNRKVARAIADGKVIGWFQGRMEWGPRALGNRSILGDPRRADMKAILNEKIKRRESFRPFAPSILQAHVADWFEEVDDVPFMMQVFQIRHEKRAAVPAVTHVDGSGRLQTVAKSANAPYHALITAFKDITGVPMVLNTSFNENEPVVCTPNEALDCFLRTMMDVLVLEHVVIERSSSLERSTA